MMAVHLFWTRPVADAACLFLAFVVVSLFMEVLGTRRYRLPLARMSSSLSGLFPSLLYATLGLFVFALLYGLFWYGVTPGLVGSAFVGAWALFLHRRRLTLQRTA